MKKLRYSDVLALSLSLSLFLRLAASGDVKIGPSGGSLFVVMKLADVKFGEAVLRVIPYLLVLWLEIFIIASFPQVLLKMMM